LRNCAVIPFYNEFETIKEIISKTLQYVDCVIAVDDGSSDSSKNEIDDSDKVFLLRHKKNLGKGAALKTGFQKAIELGYDLVVTLDADLQHDPKFIPDFLKELENNDIVVGNRLNDISAMPIQRRISNTITSSLLSLKTKQKIKDSQCGFRAFRLKVLKEVNTHYSGFEAESEMLVRAARKKFKIGFTRISTIYGNEKSKMKSAQAIFGFLKVLFS
jgi:glycosyltransferase involved in cell wall biosynthesis